MGERITEAHPNVRCLVAKSATGTGSHPRQLPHGRRYFVEAAANFPEECRYILKILGKVYHPDAIARGTGHDIGPTAKTPPDRKRPSDG